MKPRWHKYQQRFHNKESSKAKQMAMRDITQECGSNKMYSKGYVQFEYLILQMNRYNPLIIQIP